MARRNRKGRPVHGILLLDKPPGGSSNQILQRVKRLYDARKAGHTGTLDPLATGMLPICLGEATKLAGHLTDADKGYETTLVLGVTTDSADADGTELQRRAVPTNITLSALRDVCGDFTGSQQQIPPMVSAIKVNGQRLYKLAREGIVVERAPRNVTISAIDVLDLTTPRARLAVRCSKGTYIRSLVADIGERLGCGAHVSALRRTFVAPFEGQAMVTIDQLDGIVADAVSPDAAQAALDAMLLPIDAGLPHMPKTVIGSDGVKAFRRGQSALLDQSAGTRAPPHRGPVIATRPPGSDDALDTSDSASPEAGVGSGLAADPSIRRVYEPAGKLVGLGRLSADGQSVAPIRVIQWGGPDEGGGT